MLFRLLFGVAATLITTVAFAREWTDTSGIYKLDAELVAFNETSAVLKRANGKLVSVELAELSESDNEFIRSQESGDQSVTSPEQMQTWTTKNGFKVRGRVLAYGRKVLTIQRQLGKPLVNDQMFSKLDDLRQTIVLRIVSQLEGKELDKAGFQSWIRSLGPTVKTYPLEGVLMELEDGEVVGVPFFLFDPKDQAVLEPGWKQWLVQAEDEEARNREDLYLQSKAMQYQQNQQTNQQIELLKLRMMGRATGLIQVWDVMIEPNPGVYGRPMTVPVQADDSATASRMVLQNYPGYRVAAVRRSRQL